MKKILILIAFNFIFLSATAQDNGIFISDFNEGQTKEVNIDASSLTFYFRFNEVDIDGAYMSNQESLGKLDKIIYGAKLHRTIDTLKVVTSASPDGSYDYNLKLAQGRALSFKEMLVERYPFLRKSVILTGAYVEDWSKLMKLIEFDFELPYRSEVIDILNSNRDHGAIGWSLRHLKGGEPLKYLKDKHLRYLRESELLILINRKPPVLTVKLPDLKIYYTIDKFNVSQLLKEDFILIPKIERKNRIAIKTNLLYAAAAFTPNLAVEIGLGKHTTLDISGVYNWFNLDNGKNNNKKLAHWLVQPEFRYFLKEQFNGHFFGVHAIGSTYNIGGHELPMLFGKGSRNYRQEGYAYGAGFSYGYQLPIAKRWNLEFNIGVGYMRMKYDVYEREKCGNLKDRGKTKNYFGPTKAGISLVFLIN